MKKLLLSALTFIIGANIQAQDSWTYSEPAGFGNNYNSTVNHLLPFKGNLYATSGTSNGEMFRSPSGTIDSWTSVFMSGAAARFDALTATTEGGGYLYTSGYSYGADSPRVYRSFDGITWTPYYTAISDEVTHVVPFKGAGTVDSMYVIENSYYGARIMRSAYDSNDPNNLMGSWDTVFDFSSIATYTNVTSTLVHSGRFYIGTGNGAQLWSSVDGVNWAMNDSVGYGFGDNGNNEITALEAFGGYIYAGTYNYFTGAQLWRSADQLTWTLVKIYTNSERITDLESTGTELWVAARGMNSGDPGLIERSADGMTFTPSNSNGFGVNGNEGTDGNFALFGNNMYYGCQNYYYGGGGKAMTAGSSTRGIGLSTGGEIWRTCLLTPPTLNLGADQTLCAGQAATLNAGPGASNYYWSTGETTQSISAVATLAGANYFCQYTDANGCDARDDISVFATPSPMVTFSNPPGGYPVDLCKGDTLDIFADAVSGLYVMDPPAVKVTHDTIIDYVDNYDSLLVSGVSGFAGVNLISFTIDSLDHSYLGDVRISLYAPDSSYIDVDAYGYGYGSNAGFMGTEFRMDAAGDLNSGTPPYTGQFLPDYPFSNLTGSPNGYWMVKTYDAAGGDQGNLLGWTLKFGYADTIMTFSWSPTTGLSSSTTLNTRAYPTVSTNYVLTTTSSSGCFSNDTIAVNVPYIDITASTAAVCYGGSYTVTTSGGSGSSSTVWTPGTYLDTTTGSTVTTTPSANITYYVSDYVSGCAVTDSISIISNPQLFATASLPQTMCFADSVILSATPSGGTPAYAYNWNDGSVNIPGQNITVSPVTATAYTLTITDSYGCTAYDNTSVTVMPSTDLRGHVSYSGGNVTSGNVVAFKYIPTFMKFDSIQSTSLNAAGDYLFPALNSGNYLIKVFPDTLAYPTLNTTYYGNVFLWDSATVITHGCSAIDTADVVMVEETGLSGSGIGFLRGRITEDIGFGRMPGDPIPGLDVKLGKNPGGAMVTSGTTNSDGYYVFTNVDFNVPGENYVVFVDIPGLGTDSSYTFVVDATTSQYLYLDYVVDSTTIHFVPNAGVGISNPAVAVENKFNVYPNPFKTTSTVEYSLRQDAEVSLEVYNVLGSKVNTINSGPQSAGNYNYRISGLESGVYFVTLTVNGNKTTQRIVVME
jgi:subtilisin-like proprotein convertase family protein